MKTVWIVYCKELREMWHNRKWLWIPLVFLLLGVMQPVLTHLMPQILKMSGGLPAGSVIRIPTPSGAEVAAKAQSQFGTLGILILVLAFMGIISGERQRGVLELVLVKPTSYTGYVLAKWAAMATMAASALCCGYLGAWYYTRELIGDVSAVHVLQGGLVYGLWLLLILTLTLFCSTWLRSQVAAAFVPLVFAIALSSVSSLLRWHWSPGSLPDVSVKLIGGGPFSDLAIDGILAFVMIVVLVAGAGLLLRHRRDSYSE